MHPEKIDGEMIEKDKRWNDYTGACHKSRLPQVT